MPNIYVKCTQEQTDRLSEIAEQHNTSRKDVVLYALWEYTGDSTFFPLAGANEHSDKRDDAQKEIA